MVYALNGNHISSELDPETCYRNSKEVVNYMLSH